MKKGNILLGALAGLAIGYIMGILFAPEKGSRTRRKIVEKGEDYAELLKGSLDDYLKSLKEKYKDRIVAVEHMDKRQSLSPQEINHVVS